MYGVTILVPNGATAEEETQNVTQWHSKIQIAVISICIYAQTNLSPLVWSGPCLVE